MNENVISTNKEERRAFWAMHIQRWKESNVTQQAYCTQERISYGSFTHWKSELFPKPKIEKNKSFIPVKIDAAQSLQTIQPQSIQIKLTTGHIVYLPTTMDTKQIASLIYHLSAPHA